MPQPIHLLFVVFCCSAILLASPPLDDGLGGTPNRVGFSGVSQPAIVMIGKPAEIALKFQIVPGFHINSNAPKSDELIPTTLRLTPAGGIATKKLSYAAGQDVSFPFDPNSKLNVYSGEFTVRALLTATEASVGAQRIHGELRYQACSDRACFPPKTLPLDFQVTVQKPK